jgi:hypothetical protein
MAYAASAEAIYFWSYMVTAMARPNVLISAIRHSIVVAP